MKKSKKNYAIIVLIVILLALAIGYAAFSATLTINGTVKSNAEWDVKFTAGSITGAASENNKVTFTDKVMTVKAELGFPGDGREVTATITNAGTINAKLTGFTLKNEQNFDADGDGTADVIVTLPTIATTGTEIIEAGKSCPVTFTIQWDENSEAEDLGTATFDIEFTYEQSTDAVTVTPAHGSHS